MLGIWIAKHTSTGERNSDHQIEALKCEWREAVKTNPQHWDTLNSNDNQRIPAAQQFSHCHRTLNRGFGAKPGWGRWCWPEFQNKQECGCVPFPWSNSSFPWTKEHIYFRFSPEDVFGPKLTKMHIPVQSMGQLYQATSKNQLSIFRPETELQETFEVKYEWKYPPVPSPVLMVGSPNRISR